ncbi:cobalamin-dependent protein, partial [bacterium]|nr:cobalamin-dependent protein [bacterium]
MLTGRYKEIANGSEVYPQGLCILGAVARNHGITPVIIDAKAKNYDEDTTIKKILDENPDYLGITAPTMLISSAASIAEKIKKINPNIITMVGGPHISAEPIKTMQKFPYIDFGCIGEGEITLPELCDSIKNNKPLDKVKGIIFRKDGKIIQTEQRPYIKNLDDIPMPAWDLLPDLITDYQQSVARVDKLPSISLSTSRGCPSKCTFCARNVFGNLCRCYSADRVMATIYHLKNKYKIKSIAIE